MDAVRHVLNYNGGDEDDAGFLFIVKIQPHRFLLKI